MRTTYGTGDVLFPADVNNFAQLTDLGETTDATRADALIAQKLVQSGYFAFVVARSLHLFTQDFKHVNNWGAAPGNLKLALQDVPDYTTIILDAATYNICGLYKTTSAGDGVYVTNTKKGLRLLGAGLPKINSTGHFLEGGTVIQGSFVNTADGLEVYNLGIDVGIDVVAANYAGQNHEVFVPGINVNYPSVTTTIKNVRADLVIALGATPTIGTGSTYMHSMLFENIEGCHIGHVEAVGAYHGFVSKIINLQADSIIGRGYGGDSVIFKNHENACNKNSVSKVTIDSFVVDGTEYKAAQLAFQNSLWNDGVTYTAMNRITIGELNMRNLSTSGDPIFWNCTGASVVMSDIMIGSMNIDSGTNGGSCMRLGFLTGLVQRVVIGSFNLIANGRFFEVGSNASQINLGNGTCAAIGDNNAALMTLVGDYSHGDIQFNVGVAQTATYMVAYTAGALQPDRILFTGSAGIPTSRFFSTRPGSLSLGTNIVDSGLGAFAVAGAVYQAYRTNLKGVIKTNAGIAANAVIATASPGPLKSMRFNLPGQSGASYITVPVEIASNGQIKTLNALLNGDYVFLDQCTYDNIVQ